MSKAPEKPSTSEEEFIARQEVEKLRKAALEKHRQMELAEKEELKKLHFMHCPKCGMELHAMRFKDLAIEKCYNCHGTWPDPGELEALAGKAPGPAGQQGRIFHK